MAAALTAEAMDVDAPARPLNTFSVTMSRSPHDLLAETRASIEKVAARMLAVKKDGAPKSELRELVTQMSLLLVTLRQVNREILMEEDKVKAETEAAKAPVDSTTLQLHNLLYEKNHYVKAIRACLDFQTKYPGIELVPEEEFQRSAPADILEKTLAADASHDVMLKRLNFELVQRKELCKLHEKLEQQRSSLLETIANQKKFLSSLPSHLKSLKKASLPVQQQLGMQHTKKLKQHHAAELLPTPLYIAYTQLLGQKEAFGENIEVEIMGSTKDAQIFAQQQAKKENAARGVGVCGYGGSMGVAISMATHAYSWIVRHASWQPVETEAFLRAVRNRINIIRVNDVGENCLSACEYRMEGVCHSYVSLRSCV